ncbi:MAG: DNA cytosine methyltransferase, partial [Nanoarchaeota archaeon]|nr:DNA cytosine methyltransferase [Nanoarchaeota archaeon]
MKVLDLYAGVGGNRKLWTDVAVTAIENTPDIAKIYQDFFPYDKVIVADAHQYLLEHYKEFDFIWSSPPCPSHSDIRRCGVRKGQYP